MREKAKSEKVLSFSFSPNLEARLRTLLLAQSCAELYPKTDESRDLITCYSEHSNIF